MKPLFITILLIVLGSMYLYINKNNNVIIKEVAEVTSSPIVEKRGIEIKASFKIITNGTTRIFTDSKYHNQSNDIYIEKRDPSIINVNRSGITWGDFFKTLPMSLDKSCLVTGTNQSFCTNETKKLFFYINDIETPDALDRVINKDDFLLIEYK